MHSKIKWGDGKEGDITNLRNLSPGETFRSVTCVHQKHGREDVFMLMEFPDTYVRDEYQRKKYTSEGWYPCVNLSTGAVAGLTADRKVRRVLVEATVETRF